MLTYFVLVTLRDFDEIRRQIGYFRASDVLDDLAREIGNTLPAASKVRTSRSAVEFLLNIPSSGNIGDRLRAIAEIVTGSSMIRRRTISREAVIGAARCPRRQVTDAVILQAENALRLASVEHKTLCVADEGELDELTLMEDLDLALRSEQLQLFYQPKLHARTGQITACEALVRWQHPVLGNVTPDRFVGVAERRDEIAPLTNWTMSRAIRDSDWLRAQGIVMPIYVNLSARLITDEKFIDQLLTTLRGHEASIGLELTETCMIGDPEGALASMNRLARVGLKLAIDDYGAGFSSLAYLRRLPVNELKIDRLFIARLTSGARDPLLVRSTIDLAHALEMEVTAEGVDSAAALALLQVMRCDMVQGFFLARPMPIDQMLEYARGAADRTSLDVTASLASRFGRRDRKAAA